MHLKRHNLILCKLLPPPRIHPKPHIRIPPWPAAPVIRHVRIRPLQLTPKHRRHMIHQRPSRPYRPSLEQFIQPFQTIHQYPRSLWRFHTTRLRDRGQVPVPVLRLGLYPRPGVHEDDVAVHVRVCFYRGVLAEAVDEGVVYVSE
ncbi:hypothetical protein AA313_de0203142 [Arthrobotrys entomopaga]|nr:hypothetical protein AA313_de0203142 [Arthrobotrys entomopaga]